MFLILTTLLALSTEGHIINVGSMYIFIDSMSFIVMLTLLYLLRFVLTGKKLNILNSLDLIFLATFVISLLLYPRLADRQI